MEQPMFGRKLRSSLETTSRRSKGKAGCYIFFFYFIAITLVHPSLGWFKNHTGLVKALLLKAGWLEREPVV